MSIYFSVIIAILAVECFTRVPFAATTAQLLILVKKALGIIRSRNISDHWKEKVLLRYSWDLAILSWKIVALLVCVVFVVAGIAFLLDWLFNNNTSTLDYLLTWQGLVIVTISSIIYYFLRRKFA